MYMYTAIPGWSQDDRSYYGVLGYSDIPCTPSRDGPRMSVVTMVYWDTLTYTVYMYTDIPGWSQMYTAITGWSQMYTAIPGLSQMYTAIPG